MDLPLAICSSRSGKEENSPLSVSMTALVSISRCPVQTDTRVQADSMIDPFSDVLIAPMMSLKTQSATGGASQLI